MEKEAQNVSVLAVQVGSIVKHLPFGQNEASKQSGVVTHIVPATGKVYVSWPTHGNTQHDPDELLLITDGHGMESPLSFNLGSPSWEKTQSERLYGRVTPHGVKQVVSVTVESEEMEKAASAFYYATDLKVIGYDKEAAKKISEAKFPGSGELVDAAFSQED